MQIECKFDLDEEVWVLGKKHIYEKCNICNEGQVVIKEETFRCPKCKGATNGVYVRAEYEVRSYFIDSISIEKDWDLYKPIKITYALRHFFERITYDDDGNEYHHDAGNFDENELFATEELALIKCEEKNSKIVEPSPWVKAGLLWREAK